MTAYFNRVYSLFTSVSPASCRYSRVLKASVNATQSSPSLSAVRTQSREYEGCAFREGAYLMTEQRRCFKLDLLKYKQLKIYMTAILSF